MQNNKLLSPLTANLIHKSKTLYDILYIFSQSYSADAAIAALYNFEEVEKKKKYFKVQYKCIEQGGVPLSNFHCFLDTLDG